MPSPAQLLDALEDGVARLRIDADRRLVEDQQRRAVEQADADVEPALHPARELLDRIARPVGEPDDAKHLVDPGRQRRRRVIPYSRPKKREVLPAGQVGVDGELLGHRPMADLALTLSVVSGSTVDDDRARRRPRAARPPSR